MSHRTSSGSASSLADPVKTVSRSQLHQESWGHQYDPRHALVSKNRRHESGSKPSCLLQSPPIIPTTPSASIADSVLLTPLSSSPWNYEQSPQSVRRRSDGWLSKFEPAPVVRLLVHVFLCALSFPVIFLLARAASGLSLFWARLIVGGLCSGVGLILGGSLLELSRGFIEAALWATIIHESLQGEIRGELDYHTHNPRSSWSAILLLYRCLKRAILRNRKDFDDRTPWGLCIVLFLIATIVAGSLGFAFGRVVDIYTIQQTQTQEYYEAAVAGDISPEEISRATLILNDALSDVAYTWTITPLSSSQHVPTDRYFHLSHASQGENVIKTSETIHFSETFAAQLDPTRPTGFGTYQTHSQIEGLDYSNSVGGGPTSKAIGQIVRWPRWGSRIGCQIIEDLGRYLTPRSSKSRMTYLFVPWKAVNSIFSSMGIPPPGSTTFGPVDFNAFMEGADTPSVQIKESEVAMMSKWWDNGVSHSFDWFPVNRGDDGNGWITVEIVMVRLNQSYTTENSSFQVYGPLGEGRTRIGFDAAICVEEVRGYVVDAYNSSAGSPISLSLQYNGTQLNTFAQDDSTRQESKRVGDPISAAGLQVQDGISSAGKFAVYNASHYNARNIILKDNGRDWWFAPNPTVVAFGGGDLPTGYTKLDADNVAKMLANSDSQHLLPYLVGSQPVLAHVYPDKTIAYTYVHKVWLAIVLAIVLAGGIIVSIFVPRLPGGVPRKNIGVRSWLVAIEGE